jgi:hypothetical protein
LAQLAKAAITSKALPVKKSVSQKKALVVMNKIAKADDKKAKVILRKAVSKGLITKASAKKIVADAKKTGKPIS